jgi:photosystem II stability/assembly factor-like uncharacterized protein
MKKTASLVMTLITTTCFAQTNSSLLFSGLNSPKDNNSCYDASPGVALHTNKDQILLQSTNGGTSWIDISDGLPKGTEASRILPKNEGIYLGTAKGKLYFNPDLQPNNWELQNLEIKTSEGFFTGIYDLPSGIYASVYKEGVYKQVEGSNNWKQVYTNLENHTIFSLKETSNGSVIAATANGLYLSKNKGESWEHVYKSWVNDIVSAPNSWIANSADGIIRSDDGEHWSLVLKEVAANFKLGSIDGYFVALRLVGSYNQSLGYFPYTSFSSDGGISWQNMSTGKPSDTQILDLEKAGDYLISSRESGISRSNDLGKTWQLLVSPPDKLDPWQFEITVHKNSLFAVLKWGGC